MEKFKSVGFEANKMDVLIRWDAVTFMAKHKDSDILEIGINGTTLTVDGSTAADLWREWIRMSDQKEQLEAKRRNP